jgi:hypothetical protein
VRPRRNAPSQDLPCSPPPATNCLYQDTSTAAQPSCTLGKAKIFINILSYVIVAVLLACLSAPLGLRRKNSVCFDFLGETHHTFSSEW